MNSFIHKLCGLGLMVNSQEWLACLPYQAHLFMKYDKETFKEVLEPHHRTYWKIAYTKLQRKMQSLKSSLKKRSEDSNVIFMIEMSELREMFYNNYGDGCKYCKRKMTLRINTSKSTVLFFNCTTAFRTLPYQRISIHWHILLKL